MLTHWSNQKTPGPQDHQVKGERNKACHISSWLWAIGSIVLAYSELTMSVWGAASPEQWVPFSSAQSYAIAIIQKKKILKAHYFIDSSDPSGRVLIHPKLYWTRLRWSAIFRATELMHDRWGISNFHTVFSRLYRMVKRNRHTVTGLTFEGVQPVGHRKGGFCCKALQLRIFLTNDDLPVNSSLNVYVATFWSVVGTDSLLLC